MSIDEAKARKWQIGLRGMFHFTTALGVALSLCYYSRGNPNGSFERLGVAFGILVVAGAVGGLLGQLLFGTDEHVETGILTGLVACVLAFGIPYLMVMPG